MKTLDELNKEFGLPGVLRFELHGSLPYARITTPAANATVFLHGAHVTDWEPAGQGPVLFVSERSEYMAGKAIRGGIPVCFPWFGPRWDGAAGPAHGFARLESWELVSAALAGDELHLSLLLGPTERSRSLGYDSFQLALEVSVGSRLRLRLSVLNNGTAPLVFEEALHSYFGVEDVQGIRLLGLESALYLDKTEGMREHETTALPLRLSGETDWVFPENVDSVTIVDSARRVIIDKSNSATTVLWNPWERKAASMGDLEPATWRQFVCLETANTGANRLTLAPGEAHTMQTEIYSESGEQA